MRFQQMPLTRRIQQAVARGVPSILDASEQPLRQVWILNQAGIMGGNSHIGFRQHHFHIGKDSLEIGPFPRHRLQQSLIREIGQGLTGAIPAR